MLFQGPVLMYRSAVAEYSFVDTFGESESKLNTVVIWVLFLFITLILNVLMMSLLIPIVSHSYSKIYHSP
jgi:hypothetical protein